MLGRLIQGYARGSQLESATDETHTRTLLWPEFQIPDPRPSSVSPPPTPFGSPTLRVSPFDDKAGLELKEGRDLRLVVAQDAFGTNDRPLLLFDTYAPEAPAGQTESTSGQRPSNSPSISSLGPRADPGIPINGHARNRSSTISGASASWVRSTKDTDSTDHLSKVLDCMFGVSSAAKAESSTKMHLLPGDRGAITDLGPRTSSHHPSTRAPLLRARTATQVVQTQRQHPAKEPESEARDAILITRVFAIALPDAQEDIRQHRTSSADHPDGTRPVLRPEDQHEIPGSYLKRPKIVEKKTPVFAIGLLCYLPSGDTRPATSYGRPPSRASFSPSEIPNSYGSESMSSWTFLNAIPEHLMSSESTGSLTDKGVDIIVKNWDVILRSLGVVEQLARIEIGHLLQQVNLAIISSNAKAPKGPSEQRTNQRNVYLRNTNILAPVTRLHRLVKQILWRISYAFRVPRVLTGFGLENGGHWLDESRYLVRICGNKQQNFFLFNLLTAFLGNHTEWLERLGPDWYRKQFKAMNRGKSRPSNLASRTVIVCENRSTARRFIFLLASFLPRSRPGGLVAKSTDLVSPLLTPDIISSSPANKTNYEGSIRRHAYGKSRDNGLTFTRREVTGLSTSASSNDSLGGIGKAIRNSSRSILGREELQQGAEKLPSIVPATDGSTQVHKTIATSSTVTPNAGTPVPHFTSKNDSYFPDSAVFDGDESGASADLARILRRDSSSYASTNQSTMNWGSLISNVSGFWSRKSDSPAQETSHTLASGATDSLRERRHLAPRSVPIQGFRPGPLETMVDEVHGLSTADAQDRGDLSSVHGRRPSTIANEVPAPNLTVDDRDGVIDVDINIPGFIGWSDPKALSLPASSRHHSPSVLSEELGSSYSSRSVLADNSVSRTINVAGFLKRYHEDFSLQGVKSYLELQDEVKQSMSREMTPPDEFCGPLTEDEAASGGRWVNVCTTLLADVRSFTIQRITLRRRIGKATSGDKQRTGHSKESHKTTNSAKERQMLSSLDFEEDFAIETVMDFDTTLADAIERVLIETQAGGQKSVAPSRSHSRAVSTGTIGSAASEPLEIAGLGKIRDHSRPAVLSQSDCRQAVVGALEEVVKSVNDDLARNHRSADGRVHFAGNPSSSVTKQDNVLREGVKKWLLNVETRSVW